MAEQTAGSPWRVFLRVVGLIVAFALGVLAACLIAFGSSTKQIQLGVLAGLWSALMGTLSVNSLRHQLSARSASLAIAAPLAAAIARIEESTKSGRELEVRETHDVESVREAAARRAYERQLHEMVERELSSISRAMTEQLDVLRTEVTQLRGELVEKVGGQLRLERIETTRVIGSDIEALQHEVRRLAFARDSLLRGDLGSASSMRSVETSLAYDAPGDSLSASSSSTTSSSTQDLARMPAWNVAPPASVGPASAPSASTPSASAPSAAAQVVPPRVDLPPAEPVAAEPVATEPVAATITPPVLTKAEPDSVPAGPHQSTQPTSSDPFASMPRLSRFTDSEPLLPIDGDRHAAKLDDEQTDPDQQAGSQQPGGGGGRRRRAEGETNDVLARLLGTG